MRRLRAKRMNIVGEHQQRCKLLARLRDAKFRCLLDRVHSIATCIRQADDISTTTLRLKQERREILCWEGYIDLSNDFATVCFDDFGGVILKRMTKGIVSGEEEPFFAAGFGHRGTGAVRQGSCVIGPVDGGRAALFARQGRRPRAGIKQYAIFFGCDVGNRKGHRRGWNV